jgi:gas vesicle protein
MNKLFLSLIAGVAIGLLIAPDKGSKTRQKLRKGFNDYKDKSVDAVNDFIDNADRTINKIKTKVNNAI